MKSTFSKACFLLLVVILGISPLVAQDFVRQQVGSTFATIPIFQIRLSAFQFNPPLLLDLGNTAGTQNFLLATSLAGFTTTVQFTPATSNRTLVFPDGGGTLAVMPGTGGQITTNGTAVAAGTCQAQPTITITGVSTTSAVDWSVAGALPATWQTGIHVMPAVTGGTVTINLCNASAGSITPAAQLVNVRAIL